MPSLLDLTGKRFGRLTVSQRSNNDHYCDGSGYRIVMWVCDCDCGTRCTVSGKLLRAGKTTSCGCVQSEVSREKLRNGRQVIPADKMPATERSVESVASRSWGDDLRHTVDQQNAGGCGVIARGVSNDTRGEHE